MGVRTARGVQVAIMVWLSLHFITPWLPFLRSIMDGPSYRWGASHFGIGFGGAGLGGDFWFAALHAAAALAFIWCGWRRPNGLFRIAAALLAALLLASTLYSVATAPESFRFRGDTLGVDVSLTFVAPLFDTLFLLLALWFLRGPRLAVPPLGRTNRLLLGLFALLLPVQFVLLRSGQGQETSDVVGVLLTMLGWFLLSAGLAPWRTRAEPPVQGVVTAT
jgi:uncharacterized membrane protein YqaE (UPF0057 family)